MDWYFVRDAIQRWFTGSSPARCVKCRQEAQVVIFAPDSNDGGVKAFCSGCMYGAEYCWRCKRRPGQGALLLFVFSFGPLGYSCHQCLTSEEQELVGGVI